MSGENQDNGITVEKHYDKNGVLHTVYQSVEGASVDITDEGGLELRSASENGTALKSGILKIKAQTEAETFEIKHFPLSKESVNCNHDVSGQLDDAVYVESSVSDQVVASHIHRFAKENPELAAALSGNEQPLHMLNTRFHLFETESDKAHSKTFQDYLDMPSNFRGCPKELADKGIVVEKLAEPSVYGAVNVEAADPTGPCNTPDCISMNGHEASR